ncbi:hypothetical protein K438DRAFT_1602835, partial [Mycena galopus ATCC 62051]
ELREALRADDERLAASIMTTLESQAACKALLRLEGLSAQSVIDVVQDILEKGLLLDKESHSKARRYMIKLSAASDKVLSCLFISGITARDDHPLFTHSGKSDESGRPGMFQKLEVSGMGPGMWKRFPKLKVLETVSSALKLLVSKLISTLLELRVS